MFNDLRVIDGVREEVVLRGRVGVLALYGGLEAVTTAMARLCADLAGASLHPVEQPTDFRRHMPSTTFVPRQSDELVRLLSYVIPAVFLHSFDRRNLGRTALIGGESPKLQQLLSAAISRRIALRSVSDEAEILEELRGVHPRNPANLSELASTQIEMSPQTREDGTLDGLVAAIADVPATGRQDVCSV